MPDQKRGEDAADRAPTPAKGSTAPVPASDKQDAPNYKDRVDGGLAEPVEKVSSANDE